MAFVFDRRRAKRLPLLLCLLGLTAVFMLIVLCVYWYLDADSSAGDASGYLPSRPSSIPVNKQVGSIVQESDGNMKKDLVARRRKAKQDQLVRAIREKCLKEPTTIQCLRQESSVDYFSCCGLGHRLSKSSDAYFVARQLGLQLRLFWGLCQDVVDGIDVEVFNYLFERMHAPHQIQNYGTYIRIQNDVKTFKKLVRQGANKSCVCSSEKYQSDVEFYAGLWSRFRFRRQVVDFVDQHNFASRVVIGMHIRAGNNETGDFQTKKRVIADADGWIKSVVRNLLMLVDSSAAGVKSPILYIATDTALMIDEFRRALGGKVIVVSRSQQRPSDGSGVFFGSRDSVENGGKACLEGWVDALVDMMILSHADVVVASRPSSFVQTLPMILSFSQTGDGKTNRSEKRYCEIRHDGKDMMCFTEFMEWCCRGETSFSLGPTSQKYDYLRIPPPDFDPESLGIKYRGMLECKANRSHTPVCLPYDWPDHSIPFNIETHPA